MKQKLAAICLVLTCLAGHFLLPGNPHCREAFVWALAAAAIPAIVSMFKGKHDVKEGKEIASKNVAPVSHVARPWYDIVQETEKAASLGLDPTTSLQLTMGNRGMAASLRALVEAGGDPNDVAGAYDQYSDTLMKAAGINFEHQVKMADNIVNAMGQLSGAETTDFLYNKDRPYKDTAQLAAARMNAGEDQFNQGMKLLTYTGAAIASNYYNPDRDDLTKNPNPPPRGADTPAQTTPVGQPMESAISKTVIPTGKPPQPLTIPEYNPWTNLTGPKPWQYYQKIGYGG